MFRIVCRTKIQNAIITDKQLRYSGSIGIDSNILKASGLYPGEMVQILNVNNANRFETYVISEKAGSRRISLYGPAARLGEIGDEVVILSQGIVEPGELPSHKIKVVKLSGNNKIIKK